MKSPSFHVINPDGTAGKSPAFARPARASVAAAPSGSACPFGSPAENGFKLQARSSPQPARHDATTTSAAMLLTRASVLLRDDDRPHHIASRQRAGAALVGALEPDEVALRELDGRRAGRARLSVGDPPGQRQPVGAH